MENNVVNFVENQTSSEIVLAVVNNQVVVSSRQVAERFGKEHRNVLSSIRDILAAENSATKFFQEDWVEYRGQKFPVYLMNRDGFTLLAMSFTGKEAMQWKLKYIAKFNEMEQQLHKPEPMTFLEVVAANAKALVEQDRKLKAIDQKVDGIRDIVALNHIDWRKDSQQLIAKMSMVLAGDYSQVPNLHAESYKLLNTRMGVDVKARLNNKRRRMAEEGVCKSKRDKLNILDVIADDKKLIEGYTAIIKEMAIRYGASVA